jgi:hypothetical protein
VKGAKRAQLLDPREAGLQRIEAMPDVAVRRFCGFALRPTAAPGMLTLLWFPKANEAPT